MTIKVNKLAVTLGGERWIGISSDEPILGCQFHLSFDPLYLRYLAFEPPTGGSGLANLLKPGLLAVAVSGATQLPSTFCRAQFKVHGTSALVLSEVIATDLAGTDIYPAVSNGRFLLTQENIMQVQLNWSDPNPAQTAASETVIFEGDGPDPGVNLFTQKGTVGVGVTGALINVAENQGLRYFFVWLKNALSADVVPSNVANVDTTVATPPPALTGPPQPAQNLTAVIV